MSWPAFWTKKTWQTYLLLPLSKVVCWEAARRLEAFRTVPPEKQTRAKVIVVGNLVVGGSGKTPFIIWLTQQLQSKGLSVGIISRGYGGKSKTWPQKVTAESDPALVGDEPVLLAKHLGCPIAVSPNRPEALAMLIEHSALDVIISDDGLQHYALARDIEIVLFDAQRGFGNGYCLPAGPLREPLRRLENVDMSVWNGLDENERFPIAESVQANQYRMLLQPYCFRQVMDPEHRMDIDDFCQKVSVETGGTVNAIAGIGNPRRFFETLMKLELDVHSKPFADHHSYKLEDFEAFEDEKPLLMTEKDAVKCVELAKAKQKDNWWYLEVRPSCNEFLLVQLLRLLKSDN